MREANYSVSRPLPVSPPEGGKPSDIALSWLRLLIISGLCKMSESPETRLLLSVANPGLKYGCWLQGCNDLSLSPNTNRRDQGTQRESLRTQIYAERTQILDLA